VPKIGIEWRHGKFSQFTGEAAPRGGRSLQKFLGGKCRFWGDLQVKLHLMTRPRHVCAKSSELALIVDGTQAPNLPENILGVPFPALSPEEPDYLHGCIIHSQPRGSLLHILESGSRFTHLDKHSHNFNSGRLLQRKTNQIARAI
jgi:hypothetical protein